MPENPIKISIITVCYNSATTLEQTILSVKSQLSNNIEYIIIDGDSSDETRDIILRHEKSVSIWKSEPDTGIYDAMNKGLKLASGDYIGFLHADDVFSNNQVIANIKNQLLLHKPDVLYGDLEYVHAEQMNKTIRKWISGPFERSLLKKGWMPPHPTLYLKRDIIEKVDLFNTSFKIAADYDYILRVFSLPDLKTCYLPEVLVKMRIGGASNKSVRNIILKSKEDLRALKANKIGGVLTLIRKNISKLPQFFKR